MIMISFSLKGLHKALHGEAIRIKCFKACRSFSKLMRNPHHLTTFIECLADLYVTVNLNLWLTDVHRRPPAPPTLTWFFCVGLLTPREYFPPQYLCLTFRQIHPWLPLRTSGMCPTHLFGLTVSSWPMCTLSCAPAQQSIKRRTLNHSSRAHIQPRQLKTAVLIFFLYDVILKILSSASCYLSLVFISLLFLAYPSWLFKMYITWSFYLYTGGPHCFDIGAYKVHSAHGWEKKNRGNIAPDRFYLVGFVDRRIHRLCSLLSNRVQ